MYSIFIDDIRNPHVLDRQWTICRSYEEAVEIVSRQGMPSYVSFDHDLGTEKTGYDFALFLVNKMMDDRDGDNENLRQMISDFDFTVHSANPIGAENINKLLTRFIEFRGDLQDPLRIIFEIAFFEKHMI